jgi:hypothetical protein
MLLHQSLPGGVRLRLPHRTDLDGVRDLCARHGESCDDAEAMLRFDPRRRAVVIAVSFGPEGERVVGLGTLTIAPGAEPEVLIADDDEVRRHVRDALLARVTGRTRRPHRPSRGSRVLRAVTRRRAA